MKIPDSIQIGGHTYKVLKGYKFKEITNTLGQADHTLLEIRISLVDNAGNELPQEKIEQIFTHEVLHCVNFVYNGNALEESVISNIAQGTYQVVSQLE